jgi:putative ABC transport system permease protein
MALPLSYNLRNLVTRKTTTIMTALCITLTVAVLLVVLALVTGLRSAFQATGGPLNVIVMRKGATSEMGSSMSPEIFRNLIFEPGIGKNAADGQSSASLEIVSVVSLQGEDGKGTNLSLRGIELGGIPLHHVTLQQGRWFSAGRGEVVVGQAIAERHPTARLGSHLIFGTEPWEVVGVMGGAGAAANSELYADRNQVAAAFHRPDALSSVLLEASSREAVPSLIDALNHDRRLNVTAETEQSYYAAQTVSGAPLEFLGTFVSIIMAVGSAFAAMNTMYASVARRSAEIGTLRVLGFSKGSILWSFLIESVLLACLGGLLACALVLPLNGLTAAVGNLQTFSETAFRLKVGLSVMGWGMLFAVLLGALGGFLPARVAANMEILAALKGVG